MLHFLQVRGKIAVEANLALDRMHRIRDYTKEECASIEENTKLLFARDDARPLSEVTLQVKTHSTLETFTIYPRSARDVAVNESIWWTVHESSFSSASWPKGESRGQAVTVFALGIPTDLVRYLESVTLDEMYNSIICMLADAAKSEDEDGLLAMKADLCPTVWDHLVVLLTRGVVPMQQRHRRTLGPSDNRQDTSNFARTGPLTIPQRSTPDNSNLPRLLGETICTKLRRGQESCLYASFLLDQALKNAQAHDYWKIAISGATYIEVDGPQRVIFDSPYGFMLDNLYQDWQIYAKSCMVSENRINFAREREEFDGQELKCSGPHHARSTQAICVQRGRVLRTMMKLVHERQQEDTWVRARTVLQCADSRTSLLGRLPGQVVQQCIIPKVLIEETLDEGRNINAVEIFQTINRPPMDTS